MNYNAGLPEQKSCFVVHLNSIDALRMPLESPQDLPTRDVPHKAHLVPTTRGKLRVVICDGDVKYLVAMHPVVFLDQERFILSLGRVRLVWIPF